MARVLLNLLICAFIDVLVMDSVSCNEINHYDTMGENNKTEFCEHIWALISTPLVVEKEFTNTCIKLKKGIVGQTYSILSMTNFDEIGKTIDDILKILKEPINVRRILKNKAAKKVLANNVAEAYNNDLNTSYELNLLPKNTNCGSTDDYFNILKILASLAFFKAFLQ